MTSLYLVRHAQALGNVERRFQGHTDNPLTDLGRSQARLLAQRFKALPIHRVYTSPLRRAVDTASPIAGALGLPLMVEPRLIEINGGDMEDRLFDALQADYPEQFRQFVEEPHNYVPVGAGETYGQVYDRARLVIDELTERHRGETLVLVTHGCTLRCLLGYAMGRPVERMNDITWGGNTSVSHVLYPDAGAPRVVFAGDSTHLPERKAT